MRLLGVAVLLALALVPAAQAGDDPAQLATAVERDVVHVDPRASERLTVADAGRLRIRIAQRDAGRIKVLVVPSAAAERNGGIAALSNDVFRRARLRGALIVVAGPRVWITTSYDSGPALTAVQQAMGGRYRKRVAPGLLDAVDRLARVDPGPSGDAGAVPPAGVPDDGGFGDMLDDVGSAIRAVVFGVGGLIALLILIPILVRLHRLWRARREGAEDLEAGRARAREALLAVGDLVRELDIDAEMPGADATGKEALGRAIELYDRAGRELAKATTSRRLQRAHATIRQARQEAEQARRRFGGGAAPGNAEAAAAFGAPPAIPADPSRRRG
jgi:hypothetical protein